MSVPDHVIHLENGTLTSENPRPQVEAMVERALRESPEGGLVVHFHGGLVSRSSGLETANRLCPVYRTEADSWPVFFVWESGLLETLSNNLPEIFREPFFKTTLKRVFEFVIRKMAQRSEDRAGETLPDVDTEDIEEAVDKAAEEGDPAALEALERPIPDDLPELTDKERARLELELERDLALNAAVQRISNGLRSADDVEAGVRSRAATVRGSTATLMDPEALEELVDRPDPQARGALSTARVIAAVVRVAAAVIRRYGSERDHGFHATVVEEVLRTFYLANAGGFVWQLIKQDTEDAFGDDGNRAGGTALLEALAERIDPDAPPRITLVGHSTGAIFISHFLDKATELLPDSVRFDVVFLAPASTFELTARTLEDRAHRISGFRMFTMTDAYERQDRLVPALYPHSLLYFVSGVVENPADTPIVGMERFYDRTRYPKHDFPSVETVRAFIEDEANRVAWSVGDGGPGRTAHSERHGDFDNDQATVQSVVHILRNGLEA